jgi:cupin fold WbuC family metalloprotein
MLWNLKIKIFSNSLFKSLHKAAVLLPRKRLHHNIHGDYLDPCQRLFNAITIDSYIPPHKHSLDPRDECLIAIKGLFALIIFDDIGNIINVVKFGSELYCESSKCFDFGVEIPANAWHTVVALKDFGILFEVKAGPFSPSAAKNIATWAPIEGALESGEYLINLRQKVNDWVSQVD